MNPSQIIVLATPVFLLLIALEFAWDWRTRRASYGLADAVSSLSLGILSQISAVFTRLLRIGIYTAVAQQLALVPTGAAHAFWTTWYGWLLALLFYDFCYYWHHRLGHEVAVLWAAHVVHHQSEHYNLTTALRQTSSGALLGWVFYLPMALAGVPPLVFGVVALIDLLYQFWVHTEQVPRLGWFDRWFCSPSNHRVHHAVNDRYLDRNYGGILMVWDRLFGTFCEENPHEPCVYGTRAPLRSWDPLWANAEVYAKLARTAWLAPRWMDKLRVWIMPPGWQPPSLATPEVPFPFDPAARPRYQPPLSTGAAVTVLLQFGALLSGALVYLWHAETLPLELALAGFAALTAGLWATGAYAQGRIQMLEMLGIDMAALATWSSAAGWLSLHHVAKPATMLIAITLVAKEAHFSPARRTNDSKTTPTAAGRHWLLAALVSALAGDVALMWPGYFLVGLGAFLLAHLAYLALLTRDAPWFPSRPALAATLALGVAAGAVLWVGGLPAGLRAPVAAYIGVISLMTGQALGRARQHRTRAATLVAIGAVCFMASDAMLAIDRFVHPLPAAPLLVLASYYAAQWLIVGGWLRGQRPPTR